MQLRKLTTLALYTTLALAIYAVESAIPPLVPIPGIKPGLANIITLIVLRRYTLRETALVLTARILLSTLLFGQFISLLYSLAGGILSLAVMYLANRCLRGKLPFLTGAMGGLFHNVGQLLAARLLLQSAAVWAYLPFLGLGGILTGVFTGLCAYYTERLYGISRH